MTLKYNNLRKENEDLETKVMHRDKQLADSRLAVASTAEKQKIQASARKEVDHELKQKEEELTQMRDLNNSLALSLKEEREQHGLTVVEAINIVEESTAASARAFHPCIVI